MIPAPYLKTFNTSGGTLYVFPSVSKDLTRTFVSNDYEFKFSHFACLNIPDIYSGSYDPEVTEDKGFYISTLLSKNNQYPSVVYNSDGMGKAIAENLQNYVMNFETAILNGEGDNDDYDNDILTTVSEKIFWNWMQKVGAIKFNETGTLEDYGSLADRTVQYIGNIDLLNTVEINGDTFEELYIHIPSTVGASTSVYFRPGELTDNKNYLNKNYSIGGEDGEYIIKSNDREGQDSTDDNTIYGLCRKAIYDIDGNNVYVGDMGHTIDFRDTSYAGGDGISTMNGNSLEDFEFNAVLIYYDMYEKTPNPGIKKVATNLYGILFLDNVWDLSAITQEDEVGIQGYLQRYPKKKETVYGNGNSYALKIDLKVDTTSDIEGIVYEIPNMGDATTSMSLYTKALEQLQRCIDIFYTQKNEIVRLTERVATLENLVMGIDSVSALKDDVQRLYDIYDSHSIIDTSAILSLIDANSKQLNNIMNGGKDLKLQFDTDVIQPGAGIGIKKSPNKVVISSEQRYSINTVYEGDGSDEIEISSKHPMSTIDDVKLCTIPLKPGENFAVIYLNDLGDSTSNININIDDSEYNWEVGQSLKIMFVCDEGSLIFEDGDVNGIIINPKQNISLSIPGVRFEGNNLIEVICVALSDVNDDSGDVNENKFIYLIK